MDEEQETVALDYYNAGNYNGAQDGYSRGYWDGVEATLDAIEEVRLREAAQAAVKTCSGINYAELSERRGEPQRVDRIRNYWEEVGFEPV